MSSKAENQRNHARKRALERYELEFDVLMLEEIREKIAKGRFHFKERESNRLHHYVMEIQDRPVRVVYDRQRQEVVTFLPPETCYDRIWNRSDFIEGEF